MKTFANKTRMGVFGLLCFIGAAAVPQAEAQLFYAPTSNAWDNAQLNWGTALAGPFDTSWADANTATFAPSAAQTVTLGAGFNPAPSGIILDATAAGNLTLQKDAGGNTITIGASGIANNSTNRTLQINPDVALGANQTWTIATTANGTGIRLDGGLNLGANNLQIDNGGKNILLNGPVTGSGNIFLNATAGGGTGSKLVGDLSGWTGNLTFDGTASGNNASLEVSNAFNSATVVTVAGNRTIDVRASNLTFSNAFRISGAGGVFGLQGAVRKSTAGTLQFDAPITSLAGTSENMLVAAQTNSIININGGVLQGTNANSTVRFLGNGVFNVNSAMSDDGSGKSMGIRLQDNSVTVNMNADHDFDVNPILVGGTLVVTNIKDSGVNSGLGTANSVSFGASFGTANLATLRINASGSTDRALSFSRANGAVSNRGIVEVTSTNVVTWNGAINTSGTSTSLVGAVTFEKSGTGTLDLRGTGTNTFSGRSYVNQGLLAVNTRLTNAASLSVRNGGTLGGTGQVTAITLESGGVIAPGNSPGTLTGDSLTWDEGGKFTFELGTNQAGSDLLSLSGAFTKGLTGSGGWVFDFYDADTLPAFGEEYKLIGFGSSSGFAVGDFSYNYFGSLAGFAGTFDLEADGLYFTIIPEPSTLALAGVGLAALALRSARRRRG